MSIFSRLAIGTANWGKPYGLSGKQVSEDDQKRILDYCQSGGIDMIDTATAYGWDWSEISTYFNVVTKGNGTDKFSRQAYAYLAHSGVVWQPFWLKVVASEAGKIGLSIYELKEMPKHDEHTPEIIQVPYSIYDRRFESYFPTFKAQHTEIHVRSILLQGKLLEKFSPQDCISFCLMNPYVDRVIIGADSYDQFKGNLRFLHRMNSAQIHDENILDPRKWKHNN